MQTFPTSSSSAPTTTQTRRRDWSQLPPELLHRIAVHLHNLSDHVRFLSVCSPWRSAATSNPKLLPPHLPWLLIHRNPHIGRFLSLSEGRIYNLPLAAADNLSLFRSPDGWILTLSPPALFSLLNPLTGTLIPLPPLSLPKRALWSCEGYRLTKFSHSGADTVALLCPDGPGIAFCRPGDSKWRFISTSSCYPRGDFAHHKGKFFVFKCATRTTLVFEISTRTNIAEIPAPVEPLTHISQQSSHYLVESPSGDLMLVLRNELNRERRLFEFFRLEGEDSGERRWAELGGIEGFAIFVDSRGAMCFAPRGGRESWWRGNCVYFVDSVASPEDYGLQIFDVGEDRIEEVPRVYGPCFFSVDWRNAMWVVPSLHQ